MSDSDLPPQLPGAEPTRPRAPEDLEIELVVTREELQILLLAVWEFVDNPDVSRTPGESPPSREWVASEFHAIVGSDIGVGEALRERLRLIKREVDASLAESPEGA